MKALKIDFLMNGNEDETRAITFYGTAARIEGVRAALLTREFAISVDGVGKIRSAAVTVDGVRYSAKIKNGEQAEAILKYNRAARARKEAQKAAAAIMPKRKEFAEYERENPADLCNLMCNALQVARAKRGDTQELQYYMKQTADLRAQLAKAEEAEKRIKDIFDKAAAMSEADYAALIVEAVEAQHAHEDEVAREKRAKRREDSGVSALAAKYGITAEALTQALETAQAAAMFEEA